MSHVLIGGDEHQAAKLRFLLAKWGATTGHLLPTDSSPTVLDCDAVILQGDVAGYRCAGLGAMPDGAGGAAGPAAPLIFINEAGLAVSDLPAAWLVLAEVEADGAKLWVALKSAVARAKALRGDPYELELDAATAPDDSYLHFLGHELRSPLTAIKTSLEVLEGELGGLDEAADGPQPGLRMLAIALRNVRRLHKTVEWSQEFLAAGEAPSAASPQDITTAEMAARLARFGSVQADSTEITLHLDPAQLEAVAGQMVRALDLALPGRPVTLRLGGDPDCCDRLFLQVAALDGERAFPTGPNPGALAAAANSGAAGELQRLARFMVSPRLVSALGADLLAVDSAAGTPVLTLALSLHPDQALVPVV